MEDESQAESVLSLQVRDFFLVLVICNTVVVAKQPHRDTMNASGSIRGQHAPGMPGSISLEPRRHDGAKARGIFRIFAALSAARV